MSVGNLMDELQYFVSGRKKSGIIETIGFKLFLLLERSYNVPIFNRGEVLCYVKQSIKFPHAKYSIKILEISKQNLTTHVIYSAFQIPHEMPSQR